MATVEITGLFGVDFVVNDLGIWPVDINPRLPASVDIVGQGLLGLHLESYGVEVPMTHKPREFSDGVRGKAILFSPFEHAIAFPESIVEQLSFEHEVHHQQSSIADVPHKGATIEAHAPLLTTYAFGETTESVATKLEMQLECLNKILADISGLDRPMPQHCV